MNLKDKYGVPEASWKAMLKDGILSCSVAGYEEIITKVRSRMADGFTQGQAIKIVAVERNISERRIYQILEQFD